MLNVIHTCVCFRAYICTNTCLNILCKNPLKRKVASQFLNVLAQFLTHYQYFRLKKKKKSDAAPKSEEGGDKKQLCFFMQPKHSN